MAAAINGLPKYVVSTTLNEASTGRTRRSCAATSPEEVARLKQEPGKDIVISGSATLVRSLLA